MSDFGTMVGRIREDIDRGSDFDVRIKRSISDAINFYKYRRLGFNIKRAYATLRSGNETVSLPTDWLEADFLRLHRSNERDPLKEVTYPWMEENLRDDNDRGRPTNYAIQHRELRLYPIPDQTYTMVFSFLYDLKNVSLSASDGESNAWMLEGEELIRKHAMAELYVLYIDGPESMQKADRLKHDISVNVLPTLEAAAQAEQSSGMLKAWL